MKETQPGLVTSLFGLTAASKPTGLGSATGRGPSSAVQSRAEQQRVAVHLSTDDTGQRAAPQGCLRDALWLIHSCYVAVRSGDG